jgi:hypothetical protein
MPNLLFSLLPGSFVPQATLPKVAQLRGRRRSSPLRTSYACGARCYWRLARRRMGAEGAAGCHQILLSFLPLPACRVCSWAGHRGVRLGFGNRSMLKFFKLGFARTRHSSGSPALRKPSARLRVAKMPRARLVRCAGCTWARPFTFNIQAASNSSQAAPSEWISSANSCDHARCVVSVSDYQIVRPNHGSRSREASGYHYRDGTWLCCGGSPRRRPR